MRSEVHWSHFFIVTSTKCSDRFRLIRSVFSKMFLADETVRHTVVPNSFRGDRLSYIGSSYDRVRQQCWQVMK